MVTTNKLHRIMEAFFDSCNIQNNNKAEHSLINSDTFFVVKVKITNWEDLQV